MNDLELSKRCLAHDERAWRQFYDRFKGLIIRRIRQVFARHSYRHTETQVLQALDQVLDQFLFNRALEGFRRDDSLEAFVLTVTTRATIDWYRGVVADKRLFGSSETPMLALEERRFADTSAETEESLDPSLTEHMTREERLLFKILLLRYEELSDADVTLLCKESKRSDAQIRSRLKNLRNRLQEKNLVAEEQFGKLQLLFFQVQALQERPSQAAKLERKARQYQNLLREYQKRGFEVVPTRAEISELFDWDINKTDRLLRKLKDRLNKSMNSDATGTTNRF